MKKHAFTLMELLVAMLIFAIVAVMLIPNVTQNAEKELFATQVKKVQNDIQQALLMTAAEHQGSLFGFCSNAAPANTNKCFIDECLDKKLEAKFTFQNATGGTYQGTPEEQAAAMSFDKRKPQFLNGNAANFDVHNANNYQAIKLKNGAFVSVMFDPRCNNGATSGTVVTVLANDATTCGYMEIDVNAEKAPNVVGKDIHYFWINDKDGLIPFGEVDNATCGNCNNDNSNNCSKANYPQANNSDSANAGCTARVMNRGSIDYYGK